MRGTKIQWAGRVLADGTFVPGNTLNVVEGCTRVSPGCQHCYAESVAGRFKSYYNDPRYGPGVVHTVAGEDRWTGELRFHRARLRLPFQRAKGEAWFWNSMSDWLHERLTAEEVWLQLGAMAAAPSELFMTLTKRAERQLTFLSRPDARDQVQAARDTLLREWSEAAISTTRTKAKLELQLAQPVAWPLPNLWAGVSAETQATYNERRAALEHTPAAVKWWSLEPLIGPIELGPSRADWVVVGGESGPGARPMELGWAVSILLRASEQDIPVFMKQTGEVLARSMGLHDKKGGNAAEWPAILRVREFPPQAQSAGCSR